MNFIVGSLLFHTNEVMAFWLFVSLIEDCEMRDIYVHGLPGLFKHSQIINILMMENISDVYHHFVLFSFNLLVSALSQSGDVCFRLDLRPLCQCDPTRKDERFFQPLLPAQVDLLLQVNPLYLEIPRKRALARR